MKRRGTHHARAIASKLAPTMTSPRTLWWSLALNSCGAIVAAVAGAWPMAREHIAWHWWLIGLAVLTGANFALHHWQSKRRQ